MWEEIQIFIETPIFNYIFMGLSVGGIIITFILNFINNKKATPKYIVKNFNLTTKAFEVFNDLSITYKNKKYKKLCITKIAFWNAGRTTLNYEDVSKKEGLKITNNLEEQIIGAKISTETNNENFTEIKILKNKNSIQLKFDFLEKKSGFIISVIHKPVKGLNFSIEGKIKDIKKIKIHIIRPLWFRILTIIFSVFAMLMAKIATGNLKNISSVYDIKEMIIWIIIGIIYFNIFWSILDLPNKLEKVRYSDQ